MAYTSAQKFSSLLLGSSLPWHTSQSVFLPFHLESSWSVTIGLFVTSLSLYFG